MKKLRFVCWLFVLFLLPCSSSSSGFQGDPYKVLGVSSDATQDEIRSSYRKLCLKYHPDKNVNKGDRERKRCTELFKQIQAANSLIGDPESRRTYDTRSSFESSSFPRSNYQHNPNYRPFPSNRNVSGRYARYTFRNEDLDAFYRAFAGFGETSSRRRPRNPDFFGFSARDVFPRNVGKTTSFWNGGGSLKSTYIQKTKIPLQDLYRGRTNLVFDLHDSVWKSYCAAFRGGFGWLILYQSAIFAAPLLKLSKWATLLFGALVFHAHVPRPHVLQYEADILPGYKHGTKLIFREDGFETVFVIEEGPHERFTRQGNNLHTQVEILASQAKEGCTIEIESLNPREEPPIVVKLKPNQIQQTGDTVTIKHKGWPSRKILQSRGDLIVEFRIVRKLSPKNNKSTKFRRKKSRRNRFRRNPER